MYFDLPLCLSLFSRCGVLVDQNLKSLHQTLCSCYLIQWYSASTESPNKNVSQSCLQKSWHDTSQLRQIKGKFPQWLAGHFRTTVAATTSSTTTGTTTNTHTLEELGKCASWKDIFFTDGLHLWNLWMDLRPMREFRESSLLIIYVLVFCFICNPSQALLKWDSHLHYLRRTQQRREILWITVTSQRTSWSKMLWPQFLLVEMYWRQMFTWIVGIGIKE